MSERGLTSRRIELLKTVKENNITRVEDSTGASSWSSNNETTLTDVDRTGLGWLYRRNYIDVSGTKVSLTKDGELVLK